MFADKIVRRTSSWRSADGDLIAEARRFYRDVLGGREVRRDSDGPSGALWFILGRQCVAVRLRVSETGPVSLEVHDPAAVAERCWDAGYRIQASEPDGGDARLSVIDPFGRRIDLIHAEGLRPRVTRDHHELEVHK